MLELDLLKRDILAEAQEDYVGLWSIIWLVRFGLNEGKYPSPEKDRADPSEVRRLTLRVVGDLLESGLVQAGQPTGDGKGFIAWNLPPTEAVARIRAEWDSLGREPDIGEIVWFTT